QGDLGMRAAARLRRSRFALRLKRFPRTTKSAGNPPVRDCHPRQSRKEAEMSDICERSPRKVRELHNHHMDSTVWNEALAPVIDRVARSMRGAGKVNLRPADPRGGYNIAAF